jgi:8-oxo-dGTP pyrophosphatase MutT (NUDIX family)
LPYRRVEADAGLEVLLITSRRSKRWIIPKGWPIDGLAPGETAAREAFEEAGVRGRVGRSLGNFTYDKLSHDRSSSRPCEVEVFPLAVRRQLKRWPEAGEREARWCSMDEALSIVTEAGLRDLIRALDQLKAASQGKRRQQRRA